MLRRRGHGEDHHPANRGRLGAGRDRRRDRVPRRPGAADSAGRGDQRSRDR
jgi:hypothetical protein